MHKIVLLVVLIIFNNNLSAETKTATEYKSVKNFINYMAKKHKFDKKELTKLFSQVELPVWKKLKKTSSVKKKKRKPISWDKYRSIFMTKQRITDGIYFWSRYKHYLEKASKEFKVPEEIIVAILGVETNYGKQKGNYQTLYTLTNRSFNGYRRYKFYKKELENFLLLTKEQNLNPIEIYGSYAGAMGYPQFISSSYRHYAIDFDNDGKVDLLNSPIDAIGSIANYFRKHKWQEGGVIAKPFEFEVKDAKLSVKRPAKPKYNAYDWQKLGLQRGFNIPQLIKSALISLATDSGEIEYWMSYWNFYVITRYNHDNRYAMVVFQLSEALKNLKDRL